MRWIRPIREGFLALWHQPAAYDQLRGLQPTSCGRTFATSHALDVDRSAAPGDVALEYRVVEDIPLNMRCPVCQGAKLAADIDPADPILRETVG